MGNWHAAKQHPGNDEYRLDWTVFEGDIEVGIGFSADAAQQMVRQNNYVDDLNETIARQREEIERLGTALLSFIHAYANTERLDHDMVEVRLFEAWLKGCAALGIKAEPPTRRLEGSPT